MPDNSNLRSLLVDAAERGVAYRESNTERNVAPSREAVVGATEFVEPMPDKGTAERDVLAMLDDVGSPATVMMTGPRYFGFVIGGSLPVTVATNWLTTAWDQNVGMHEVTPATSFVNDLYADSLDIVELVMELEDEFDLTIPDEEAEKLATVGNAIEYIQKNLSIKS